jgi:glycerol-3-phosphate dehydrogenase
MKQKTQITFEQQETVVLRQSGSHTFVFCPRCDNQIMFVTPEILAAIAGSSEREIFRLMEAGTVHFVEKQRTYVCSECYQNSIEQELTSSEISDVKKLGA